MIKKITPLIIFFFITINCFSQKSTNEICRSYKSIKDVKDQNITLKNAIFLKHDTLIVSKKIIANSYRVNFKNLDTILLNEYKNIVFGKEKHRLRYSKEKKTIKRWNSVIKVYFDKSVSKYLKNELNSLFKELNKNIELLKITVVTSKETSNYFIYSINSKKNVELYPNIKSKAGVAYNFLKNGHNIIYSGALRINTSIFYNKDQQSLKMKELFIGSLGIFNKSTSLPCDSYLSDCYSINKELTKIDIDLLKIHYTNNYYDKIDYYDFIKLIENYDKLKSKNSNDFVEISI